MLHYRPQVCGRLDTDGRFPAVMAVAYQERIMLTESKVRWVRRLLAKGLSYRAIREITGVSRDTIGKIARHQRPNCRALRRPETTEGETPGQARPTIRCKCGFRVYPPCRICRIRNAVANGGHRQVFGAAGSDQPIGLELHPEHQKRYEQVRARRRRRHRGGASEKSGDRRRRHGRRHPGWPRSDLVCAGPECPVILQTGHPRRSSSSR